VRGRSFTTLDIAFGALALAVSILASANTVNGQGLSPASPTVRIGPVGLAPVFRLAEFGFDSNAYNRSADIDPVADFTTKMSPSVDASLQSRHVRAIGRTQFDLYYFKKLSDLNAVDSDHSAQVDLILNRLTLFVLGSRESTSHRRNLEIDAVARRRSDDVTVGAGMRLTGKTSVDVSVTRSQLKYDANSLYLGTDLAQVLNHSGSGESIAIRYAATALTKFSVEASRTRTRFDTAVDRNSEELRITPSVEFSPLALVSGRAAVGFYRRTFAGTGSQSTGPSALVDLSYTLLGRTRFTVGTSRKLEYSYLVGLRDYVEAGYSGSVTQRLGDAWDVVGRASRTRVSYRQAADAVLSAQIPDETVLSFGANLGYNIRRTRIGLYVEHDRRDTDLPTQFRGYRRLRLGSSATYVF
jgi:hypothetical protein